MHINTHIKQTNSLNKKTLVQGFTIVELIVVVIVIAILATIVIALYNTIGTKAYDVSLQSDIENAKSDLESYKKKNSVYPNNDSLVNDGDGFTVSEGNTISYSQKTYGYCLTASNPDAGHTYMSRSVDGKIIEGDCTPKATVLAGLSTATGYADGTGAAAQFNNGTGSGSNTPGNGGSIVVTPSNDIYLADSINKRIRKITQDGVVTTVAGGNMSSCVAGTGTAAGLGYVFGIVYDELTQTFYFMGCSGSTLFKMNSSGVVSIVSNGYYWARGLAFGPDRQLYVIGTENFKIYKVNPNTGISTVFVGSTQGYQDNVGTAAQFNWPWGSAFDANGNLFIKDSANYRIRQIAPDGTVTTFAGSGTSGIGNGTGTSATFYAYGPHGMAIDQYGTLYVFESNVLRTITPSAEVDFYQSGPTMGWWNTNNLGGVPVSLTFGPDGVLYGATLRGIVKVYL